MGCPTTAECFSIHSFITARKFNLTRKEFNSMHKRLHRATAGIMLSVGLLGPFALMSAALAVQKNVATHNMQGATYNPPGSGGSSESKWTTSVLPLMRGQLGGRPDEIEGGTAILALQESGAVPGSAQGNLVGQSVAVTINGLPNTVKKYEWNPASTSTNPQTYYITHWDATQAGNGNDRTSLAIVTSFDPDSIAISHTAGMIRPLVGIRHGNVWYFSAHAIANSSPAANDSGIIVNQAANAVAQFEIEDGVPAGTYSFVILADWNLPPGNMANVNPPIPATAVMIPPIGNTQPSTNPVNPFDYMIYQNPPQQPQQFSVATNGFAQFLQLVIALLISDHLPVKYRINQP
jgi:hypothetical protein